MVVTLCEIVGRDENVPAAGFLRNNGVVEHVPELWAIVLVRVIRLNIDAVARELLELATPVLESGRTAPELRPQATWRHDMFTHGTTMR